jgi:GAF domain-containing protein
MTPAPDSAFTDPQEIIADLRRQLAEAEQKLEELAAELEERAAERDEALAQQTATAEVLGVINSSPGDLAPVFDAIVEKALTLCSADEGGFRTFDGKSFHLVSVRGGEPSAVERLRHLGPISPRGGTSFFGRLVRGERVVHIHDVRETNTYRDNPETKERLDIRRIRTWLGVALQKEDTLLGALIIHRREVRPFTEKQIELLQNFAAQAVIAMENARLITETREALEQQTATAEVLGVINSSPGDLAPVFDAILEKAHSLCGVHRGALLTFDGEHAQAVATHGISGAQDARLRQLFKPAETNSPHARVARQKRVIHIPDLLLDTMWEENDPKKVGATQQGVRTMLFVPLLKEDVVLGWISSNRLEVRPFTNEEIALLQNFAAQAVIAMENARLLTETREALEQQTATAEVLQIINSSPGDLTPVFDAMLDKATTLLGADFGCLLIYENEHYRAVALRNVPPAYAAVLREPLRPGEKTTLARIAHGEAVAQISDIAELGSDEPMVKGALEIGGFRTVLSVALRRDGALLGAITAYRREVRLFTEKQIALLQNFAAQAVIAIENTRLITETREALEQQTATAAVLGVINSSPGDLAPVFDAMLEKALRLCEVDIGVLWTYDGEMMHAAAIRGAPPRLADFLRQGPHRPTKPQQRVMSGERVVQIADVTTLEAYRNGDPIPRAIADLGGVRTLLIVPLRKDDAALGNVAIYRQEVRPFTDKQIALLQNFAAQAVIAMENARLITETREARDEAETALHNLQAAQSSLIQAQKMAALGQLTAGIAHEIKNPLNFVNNFASLSTELLDELKEDVAPALGSLDENKREDVGETFEMLTGNLDKIVEHGQRADNIVKSMLEHSRGVSGERREVDLNTLIDEALNLAYHGARAQDASFNIGLERDYEPLMEPMEVAPQEMTRVFLNLFGNGFYAANRRGRENGDEPFQPLLRVATRDLGGTVEVRVRDNGTGIPAEIKDKLFQPFFTTKPTGEGTGLGLSISYDIITQQHGGTITVESEEGSYTEFTIRLPRH